MATYFIDLLRRSKHGKTYAETLAYGVWHIYRTTRPPKLTQGLCKMRVVFVLPHTPHILHENRESEGGGVSTM
jgi:hypothetical protein